jgi:4-amino-4-deoxy-L-arabinose transferase-like glycosyltransferase
MTSEPSHSAVRPHDLHLGALECWMVVLIFLTGVGLRVSWPSRLAVEHFDEGVYASNVFFSGEPGDDRYPDQHLFAPPLFPALIEFAMLVSGPSNIAALAVSIVAGSLTIPLVWWVARRWFGVAAGLASATLVALNDVHIFFSRAALTDVLLCFWLVAAVYLLWEGLTGHSRLALIAAGVSTGLAWWTKYIGWLPLAIGLAGLVPWRLFGGAVAVRPMPRLAPNLRPLAVALAEWALVAGLAFLTWSPFLWSLQAKGGYTAVDRNHRGYLVGFSGWLNSLSEQAAKLGALDGWLSIHAPLVAIVVGLCFQRFSTRRSTWNLLSENRPALIILPVTLGLTAVAGSSLVMGLGAAAGVIWILARLMGADQSKANAESVRLAGWLLAAWYVGLLLTTPLYTPYPRLALPWLAGSWLGGGLLIGLVVGRANNTSSLRLDASGSPDDASASRGPVSALPATQSSAATMLLLAVFVVCAGVEWLIPRSGVPGWEPRNGLADATPAVLSAIRRAAASEGRSDLESFIIYTYGEPAAFFQLRLAGARWVRPVKDLRLADPAAPRPRLPTFVVFGRQASLTPGFSGQLADRSDRLHFVASVPYRRSRLVTLDEPLTANSPDTVLEVYQLR